MSTWRWNPPVSIGSRVERSRNSFQIVLANAQHIKAVPGRKTDTKDCQWIAELLQHGLLRGSFIPRLVIRDLRDLTRARTSLSQEHSRIASRIQKVLEDANLKLASVASNTLGKSGRAISRLSSAVNRAPNGSRTSLLGTCAPRSRNYRQL